MSGLTIDDISKELEKKAHQNIWSKHTLWCGWMSRLDNTHMWYVLPLEYEILKKLTGVGPPYVQVKIGGRLTLRFLGKEDNLTMPPGNVWLEEWEDGLPSHLEGLLNDRERLLTNWARAIHNDMKTKKDIWDNAYEEGIVYFLKHRHLVRCVGRVLDESMEDHDLTKTNLVLYALAYMWYWPKHLERDEQVKKLSGEVVRMRHLAQEDHHPEHREIEHGEVNARRLFCDRLSVHIQKNPGEDGQNGRSRLCIAQ